MKERKEKKRKEKKKKRKEKKKNLTGEQTREKRVYDFHIIVHHWMK